MGKNISVTQNLSVSLCSPSLIVNGWRIGDSNFFPHQIYLDTFFGENVFKIKLKIDSDLVSQLLY